MQCGTACSSIAITVSEIACESWEVRAGDPQRQDITRAHSVQHGSRSIVTIVGCTLTPAPRAIDLVTPAASTTLSSTIQSASPRASALSAPPMVFRRVRSRA